MAVAHNLDQCINYCMVNIKTTPPLAVIYVHIHARRGNYHSVTVSLLRLDFVVNRCGRTNRMAFVSCTVIEAIITTHCL